MGIQWQITFSKIDTFVCKIWLGRRMSRRVSQEKKNRQMYGKLEKLTEHLLTKRHPSNLVNTIFYLVFQCFDSQIGWVDGRLEVVRGENNTDK